ncbi:MAG: accessory factor UbiK family protein [Sterolibacterium sp.]|nr:accessory factor UbiK family protein [Sterolibacterium sp.]
MLNQKLLNTLDTVSSRIAELAAQTPAKDIEKNLRALITSQLARLDLVTREEFEIQTALLARCQERLAVLEARLAEFEKQKATP